MLNALRKGFGLTFKSMFRPPVTYQYPEQPKPVAPRYHGRHVLNRHPDGLEKCVGCELCAWACPADAIYVEGADNTPEERYSPGDRYGRVYQINYLRCIFCGLCIEACPTRALTMSQEYNMSFDNRDDFILTRGELLAPLPEDAKPLPHTDAEVAARGVTYYEGWAAQVPTTSRADWERPDSGEGGADSAGLGGPEEYGDPATVPVAGGGTEPPGVGAAPRAEG